MKKLSLDQAHNYIRKFGRPLEKELFNFHFTNEGDSKKVISELEKFQNSDGGFGNALEADLRTDKSSALAISFALPILVDVGAKADSEIVKGLINYLIKALDRENLRWEITTKETQNKPHAPWWAGDTLSNFRGCFANPRGTILGCLANLEALPRELDCVLEDTVSFFSSPPGKLTMHDIICGIDLVNSKIDEEFKERFRDKLLEATLEDVERDSAKWNEYSSWPIWFVPRPKSFAYEELKDLIQENLEIFAKSQLEDGSWAVPWSWEGSFPDEWAKAEQEWKGVLIVKYLKAFKSFGML